MWGYVQSLSAGRPRYCHIEANDGFKPFPSGLVLSGAAPNQQYMEAPVGTDPTNHRFAGGSLILLGKAPWSLRHDSNVQPSASKTLTLIH